MWAHRGKATWGQESRRLSASRGARPRVKPNPLTRWPWTSLIPSRSGRGLMSVVEGDPPCALLLWPRPADSHSRPSPAVMEGTVPSNVIRLCISERWFSYLLKLSSYLIRIPVTAASSDLELWVSGDWIFGNVWGHRGLSPLWGMWGGCYRYLVGGGLRCCQGPAMHRTALWQRIIWPQMSVAPRLRNCGVDQWFSMLHTHSVSWGNLTNIHLIVLGWSLGSGVWKKLLRCV